MIPLTQQLLSLATIFCNSTGLSISRVSTLVFNDGKILSRITDGSDITTGRFELAVRWFSDNWPEGAEWPATVARPAKAEAA